METYEFTPLKFKAWFSLPETTAGLPAIVPVPPLFDVSVSVVPDVFAESKVQCSTSPLGRPEVGGVSVIVATPEPLGIATLVAVTITVCNVVTVAGAV